MPARGHSGVMLFGITPPRRSVGPERVREIAEITLGRLRGLDLDGLFLYDIDDESDRNPDERPFPYLPTMDPAVFHAEHLTGWDHPVVIYRCVGKYAEDELRGWLTDLDPGRVLSASSGSAATSPAGRRTHCGAPPIRSPTRTPNASRSPVT